MVDLREKLEYVRNNIFEKGDIKKAYKILDDLKRMPQAKIDKKILYDFCVELGEMCVEKGIFDSALKIWGMVYKLSQEKKNRVRALDEMGFCSLQLNKIKDAVNYYKRIIKISTPEEEHYINALYGIGEAFSFQNKYEKAIFYFEKVKEILGSEQIKENGARRLYLRTQISLFKCLFKLRKYDQAVRVFNETMELLKADKDLLMDIYYFRGDMHFQKEEYLEAKNWYKKALEICMFLKFPKEEMKQLKELEEKYIKNQIEECEKKIKHKNCSAF